MGENGGTGSQRRQLRQLGEDFVSWMLSNEPGMAALVEGEIARRVNAGEFVPAERLMLGAATVIRAEELNELRARVAALDEAVYKAQVLADDGDLRGAMAILDEVRPPEYVLVDDEGNEVAEESTAVDEPVETEEEPRAEEPAPEAPPEPPPAEEPQATEPASGEEQPADGRARMRVRVAPAHVSDIEARAQTGGGDGPVALEPTGRPVAMPDANRIHSCNRCDDNNVPGVQAQMSFIRTREVLCRQCLIDWKPASAADDEDEPDEPQTTVA